LPGKAPQEIDGQLGQVKKNSNGHYMELSKLRGDVVLKTILRTMRKVYVDDFKSKTIYVKRRR
jgi:hypothetical protein